MFKSMLVLEAPWSRKSLGAESVWPFVSGFATLTGIKAYYRAFSDRESFRYWIATFNKQRLPKPKLLYVATDGSKGSLEALRSNISSRTVIDACRRARNIEFIHFGSCWFGGEANLRSLLEKAEHIKWAAGYEKRIDWLDSTCFDVLLWGRLIARDDSLKGLHFQYLTEYLLSQAPGLVEALGFRFQYRRGKSINSLLYSKGKGVNKLRYGTSFMEEIS
jgi:hypothetical protein